MNSIPPLEAGRSGLIPNSSITTNSTKAGTLRRGSSPISSARNCERRSSLYVNPSEEAKGVKMKGTGITAAAVLISAVGLALHLAQAQQGFNRIDLQRHDLSIPGREA